MTTIPIALDAATLRFYERVAEHAGLPVAQVLADAGGYKRDEAGLAGFQRFMKTLGYEA